MKFFIAAFERAAKIKKIALYCFLISFLVPELQQFKEEKYHSKKWSRSLSKSIKFVMLCGGHVDGVKT